MRYSLGTNEFVWWLKECASKSKSGTASALNHFSYTVHQSRVRCRSRECDVFVQNIWFSIVPFILIHIPCSMLDAFEWLNKASSTHVLNVFAMNHVLTSDFRRQHGCCWHFFSLALSLSVFPFLFVVFFQPVQHTEMDVISNVIYEPHMRDFHFSAEVIDRPMDFSVVWLRGAKIDKTLTKLN